MRDSRSTFLARGGAWVIAQSILLLLVVVLAVVFAGDWTNLPIIAVGAVLFCLGGWIGIAGVRVLGRNRTPFPQPRADSTLIEHGIYARLRHPLYTSVMLASFGWALLWQSGPAFIAATLLVPLLWFKARAEERWLCEQFPGYAAYAARVPRFIPRFRTSRRR